MANKVNSLSHTKWMCKYHIVFTSKYRRKAIYKIKERRKFNNNYIVTKRNYKERQGEN